GQRSEPNRERSSRGHRRRHKEVQELYKVYVKERKNSVAVELSYPSERY
ncbi:unnamed protein product, partial [Ectocarpus sp. 12 AP-2014]